MHRRMGLDLPSSKPSGSSSSRYGSSGSGSRYYYSSVTPSATTHKQSYNKNKNNHTIKTKYADELKKREGNRELRLKKIEKTIIFVGCGS
jgi:hypothetical protein